MSPTTLLARLLHVTSAKGWQTSFYAEANKFYMLGIPIVLDQKLELGSIILEVNPNPPMFDSTKVPNA